MQKTKSDRLTAAQEEGEREREGEGEGGIPIPNPIRISQCWRKSVGLVKRRDWGSDELLIYWIYLIYSREKGKGKVKNKWIVKNHGQ